jgi:predicted butyrate kinase (DUF1464 family)
MTGNEIHELSSGHVVDGVAGTETVVGRYKSLDESVAYLHCRATKYLS